MEMPLGMTYSSIMSRESILIALLTVGPEMQGKVLIVRKVLYGLKSMEKSWQQLLARMLEFELNF